jgi:hypothetical protein
MPLVSHRRLLGRFQILTKTYYLNATIDLFLKLKTLIWSLSTLLILKRLDSRRWQPIWMLWFIRNRSGLNSVQQRYRLKISLLRR